MIDVYTGSNPLLVYSLEGQGLDNDNRGTALLSSGSDGKVSVKVMVDGKECGVIWQQISIANSQNSNVAIVAAYDGKDGDGLYNDAYVILTWSQPAK